MATVGYVGRVKAIGVDSLKAGAIGGILTGIGGGLFGTFGAIPGAILAGAAVGGQDGRIVAINGVQDAITAAIVGAMRGGS